MTYLSTPKRESRQVPPAGDGVTAVPAVLTDDARAGVRPDRAIVDAAALVYSLDEAVMAVSDEGSILSWNRGAERTFGYPAFEVVGRNISVLIGPSDAPKLSLWWQHLKQGVDAQRHEIQAIRNNGVVITLDVTISPLEDGSGAVNGASIIARDVTEHQWMATTLESTLMSLEAALKKKSESEEQCRRFLADAAHQLRTPIAGIRACAETLLRGVSPSERDQLLVMVVRETTRASRVMSGLLAIARVDRGQELAIRPCNLVALCTDEAAVADHWRPVSRLMSGSKRRSAHGRTSTATWYGRCWPTFWTTPAATPSAGSRLRSPEVRASWRSRSPTTGRVSRPT